MSHKITFNFDDKLKFQQEAIQSVLGLFHGQDRELGDVIYRGAKKHIHLLENDPIRNRMDLGITSLFSNLKTVQHQNQLFPSVSFDEHKKNFTIEMETGTGKTYVYLRTILELFQNYNFMKFLIVVPSVAIRKGIEKSIEMLQDHFKTLYDGMDILKHSFVYEAGKPYKIRDFAESRDLSIIIMNIQAFNKESNIIRKENESGLVYWDLLQYVNPIVIIDEPQKLEGAGKKKSSSLKAIEDLQPIFTLRYSATHRKLYHPIYKLDSYQAYKQNLVKKIEVKTMYANIDMDYPYLHYRSFTRDLKARIEIFTQVKGKGIKKAVFDVRKSSDLYALSGNLEQYRNWTILEEPHKLDGLKIGNLSTHITLKEGENNLTQDSDLLIRIQIRLTIQRHFEKQLKLLEKGWNIKVLSLFFIDRVSHFRSEESADGRGKYAIIFDEEYKKVSMDTRYNKVFQDYPKLFPECKNTLLVREGYFARDAKNKAVDIEDWDDSKDETSLNQKAQEDIDRGVQLILERKDELISFDEPLAFIFSHSALREGWDNPNVFQLCTLKHGSSEIAKKQEIGRGLRLPVDIQGNRCMDADVNVLTVIANDSYEHFAEMMQQDFNTEAGYNQNEVTYDVMTKSIRKSGIPEEKLTPELLETLRLELITGNIINDKTNCLTSDANQIIYMEFTDETLRQYSDQLKESFVSAMQERGSQKIEIINGDEEIVENGFQSYIHEASFQELWKALKDRIQRRSFYKVSIDNSVFVTKCIDQINEKYAYHNKNNEINVNTTKGKYKDTGIFIVCDPTKITILERVHTSKEPKSDFEIVNYLMQGTMLPRKSLFAIINGIDKKEVLQNQEALDQVLQLIVAELKVFEVRRIEYEVVDEYIFEEKTLFEVEEIRQEMLSNKRAYQSSLDRKVALHKYIRVDSDGEHEFARNLDADPNVLLFTKFKRGGFVIDTPYGEYSPDWAIIYQVDDQTAKLYFVIETKCDKKDRSKLSEVEGAKIDCAKKHFQSLGEDVHFDWVYSHKRFQELAQEHMQRKGLGE
jgi:type III restriction enzyme